MQVYMNIYPVVMCVYVEMGMFSLIFYRKTVSSPLLLIFQGENDLKRDFIYKTFTKCLHELHTMVSCEAIIFKAEFLHMFNNCLFSKTKYGFS